MHCWTDRALPPLLHRALVENGVTFPPSGPFDLHLPRTSGKFAQTSRALSVPDNALVGALAGCGFLTGKRAMWVRLVQSLGRATAMKITPPTWLLDNPADRAQLRDAFVPGLYVLKGRREHRKGLRLVSKRDEILAVKQDVVQRVITDGIALNGRRVQLRLYLLLTQHRGSLGAWLYRDGRCLYAAAEGTPFDTLLDTRQVHPRVGLPTTLQALAALPGLPGADVLLPRIQAMMRQVMQAMRPLMLAKDHLDHARCFQLLGVDVLLTGSGVPVLIEANKGPSLVQTSRDDERFKRTMLAQMLALAGVTRGNHAGFEEIL